MQIIGSVLHLFGFSIINPGKLSFTACLSGLGTSGTKNTIIKTFAFQNAPLTYIEKLNTNALAATDWPELMMDYYRPWAVETGMSRLAGSSSRLVVLF